MIKNNEQYEESLNRIDKLWVSGNLSKEDEEEFIKLTEEIEKYESKNFKIDPPTEEEIREFEKDQGIIK